MTLFMKIAFLNVLRNTRRSTITILAIVIGCVSLIIFGGFMESMYEGLRESWIRSELGHIQIYKQGFNEFGSLEPEAYLLTQPVVDKVMAIVEAQPGVLVVTSRLNFSGLLSNGTSTSGVIGVGMDAERESIMNSAIRIIEGEDLFQEDVDGGLVGAGLAESMMIKAGDYLTLLSSTADGAVNAVDIKVSGIMTTGTKELDDRVIRINLPHAQNLMFTDNITRMVVLLDKTADTERIQTLLEKEFKTQELALETRTWSDLAHFYHKVVTLMKSIFGFIKLIVLLIVVLSIANTMVMAVMERTTEIGTIRALGNTRFETLRLFIYESLYLGICGGILGIILGVFAAKMISSSGLMMPPPPGGTSGYPVQIRVLPNQLVEAFYLGLLAAVLSSVYPAIKASRLKIVDALRFN